MAVLELSEFAVLMPLTGALFGLDLGEKTIGVAVSDATRTVASPLSTLRKTKFTQDAEALFRMMDERRAVGIVIGLPVNMDGSEGVRCQSNRAFARNLLRLRPELPITFWDERMSTMAVNRFLIDELDASRARRAELVDSMAAGWILQGALERLRDLRG
jgi:putative Holliday junction resolvase